MNVGGPDGGDAHQRAAMAAGDSRHSAPPAGASRPISAPEQKQRRPASTPGESRPRSHPPGRSEDEAYRPVSMSMSPSNKRENPSSLPAPPSRRDQETYAEAVGELAPDDMPCPSGGGDSHEFVASWTPWDLVAGCLCCPCHTLSACMCTYLFRDPRKDSFDGAGCKGTGKKTCVKCGQTWEEAERHLVELKQRAAAAGPSPLWKAPPAAARGKGESGRVRNKDRLKRGLPPPSAPEY